MRAPVHSSRDTIVACATAPGVSAIAIVRLSGPLALALGARIAPPARARRPRVLSRARVLDTAGRVVDDALVAEMPAPHSYTGEDVVELHLHGAPAVVDALIAHALAAGARLAERGEFTQRAFLNGRLDLRQAEAVAEILGSENAEQLQDAMNALDGKASAQVLEQLQRLESVIAVARAAFDFAEHATGADLGPEHDTVLREIRCKLQLWLEGARLGVVGARHVVVSGAPNVGKSSLINAWYGAQRVLVDDTPGTTRDPVEIGMTRGVMRWSVWDTAGLHEAAAGLEARGAALARARAQEAELVVWLVGPDAPVWPDRAVWPDQELSTSVLLVGAKADTASARRREALEAQAAARGLALVAWVSPHSGEGVHELRERIEARLGAASVAGGEVRVLGRQRQLTAVRAAVEALLRAEAGRAAGETLDVVTASLEEAAFALGQVLGRNVEGAVLEQIFADFCIGK